MRMAFLELADIPRQEAVLDEVGAPVGIASLPRLYGKALEAFPNLLFLQHTLAVCYHLFIPLSKRIRSPGARPTSIQIAKPVPVLPREGLKKGWGES